jgi:hypothetical protein
MIAAAPIPDILERYFAQYADTPREVIVKTDLLRLGHWFTDAALDATAGAMIKSYRLFSFDFIPMSDMRRKEHLKAPEHFFILGGRYDLRPVMVQTSMSPDAPYVIDVIDGRLVLTASGHEICEVLYEAAPRYYSERLADGTPYGEIIANGWFVTAFRNCQYWGPQEECRFCDINFNAHQMKQSQEYTLTAPVKPLDAVVEVAAAIERDAHDIYGPSTPLDFLITGGAIKSTLHGKSEEEFYVEYVEAVKWSGPRRFINLQTNARPRDICRQYRNMGVDSHQANMEVWDRRLFEWIVPGKASRVGWDNWVRWLIESVDVFGENRVRPLFVIGVEMARPYGFETVEEAVASTTAGVDYLMSHGVIPRFNQWRREPRSTFCKETEQPDVPLDYFIQVMRNKYELWKQYKLPLPFQNQMMLATRYVGVSHSAHEDYIFLKEDTYPADIVDIIRRASVPSVGQSLA